MGITQTRRRANVLRGQIEDWCEAMRAVTPAEDWGEELARLLEHWAWDYGVVFTPESYEALQLWMYQEQELALLTQAEKVLDEEEETDNAPAISFVSDAQPLFDVSLNPHPVDIFDDTLVLPEDDPRVKALRQLGEVALAMEEQADALLAAAESPLRILRPSKAEDEVELAAELLRNVRQLREISAELGLERIWMRGQNDCGPEIRRSEGFGLEGAIAAARVRTQSGGGLEPTHDEFLFLPLVEIRGRIAAGTGLAALRVFASKEAATSLATRQSVAQELTLAAERASQRIGHGSGPVHGTRVHSEFAAEVRALGDRTLATEQSYLKGHLVPRGTPGSIRVDVIEGPIRSPIVVYDLKTGSAKLTQQRIQQIQTHLPGGKNVPVIEVRP